MQRGPFETAWKFQSVANTCMGVDIAKLLHFVEIVCNSGGAISEKHISDIYLNSKNSTYL